MKRKTSAFWASCAPAYTVIAGVLVVSFFMLLFTLKAKATETPEESELFRQQCVVLSRAFHVDENTTQLDDAKTVRLVRGLMPLGEMRWITINLNCNRIGDEGIKALSPVLGLCPRMTHLHLCDNPFGDEGAEVLFASLLKAGSLTFLDVRKVPLTFKSVPALSKLLEANKSLDLVGMPGWGSFL